MRSDFSRRQVIGGAVASGLAASLGLPSLAAATPQGAMSKGNTPGLSTSDRDAIDAMLGKKGAYNEPQGTHVVALPRNDLKVSVNGSSVPIPLGFGGWAAFKRTMDGKTGIFMSDNVLLEEEINPLIDAAQANGLEVGAIHNHFLYETPRILYMHLHGMGEPGDLAARYAKALAAAGSKILPRNQPAPNPSATPGKHAFDVAMLDGIVGKTGVPNGPAFKYTVGRVDMKISEMGADMTTAIGLNTWCTFVGTPDAAVVAGDVAMLAHEVNPTIKTLRAAGVEVCAVHSHMLTEKPRILFLHYLGRGKAEELARTFRTVLDGLGKMPPMDMHGMR